MPNIPQQQNSFTAGEWTPELHGRSDLEQHRSSARSLMNMLVQPFGGVRRRYGTQYCGLAKTSAGARLLNYSYSRSQSYLLELGENYLRVWQDGQPVRYTNGAIVDIATPYTLAQVNALDYAQSADTMILVHPDVQPQRLRRFSQTLWRVDALPLDPQPVAELGSQPNSTLNLFGGLSPTNFNVTGEFFVRGDGYRVLRAGSGAALLANFSQDSFAGAAVQTLLSPFDKTSYAVGEWYIEGTQNWTIKPLYKAAANQYVNLQMLVINSDPIRTGPITSFWRTSDIGTFIEINGGLCKIIQINSADPKDAVAICLTSLGSDVAAPAGAWRQLTPSWSALGGYPRTVSFHEQRLVFGGTYAQPQTIWGSAIGAAYDFTPGVLDADAYEYTLANTESSPIEYLLSRNQLLVFTSSKEGYVEGAPGKPITPNGVGVKWPTAVGCARVRPVEVGRGVFFTQASQQQIVLFAQGLSQEYADYDFDDVSLLAGHLFQTSSVVSIAFQKRPTPLLWVVFADGSVAIATIEAKQGVRAWVPMRTQGMVESVAVVSRGAVDDVYFVVCRMAEGAKRRFIERAQYSHKQAGQEYGWPLDCATIANVNNGAIAGLPTVLDGLTVSVLAAGCDLGDKIAVNGAFPVDAPQGVALVGFAFTSEVIPQAPEPQGYAAKSNRVYKTTLRLLNSIGGTANGEALPVDRLDASRLDGPPKLFTGDVETPSREWASNAVGLTLTQNRPLPLGLQLVIHDTTVNG